jgi:hypothetical protein
VSAPVKASVPHRLGKAEAARRLKDGLSRTKGQFGALISLEREVWSGDTLHFHMRALGQTATGSIEVLEDRLVIEVALPWLLAKVAERLLPAIRREATLLLEKK